MIYSYLRFVLNPEIAKVVVLREFGTTNLVMIFKFSDLDVLEIKFTVFIFDCNGIERCLHKVGRPTSCAHISGGKIVFSEILATAGNNGNQNTSVWYNNI